MDGAALFALFAAVGFGWQPMPDGSERYEYIVQVDQDLAATLAAGKSIPIVGEVPEGIHPIGRVRIVVGEESLPRERLVTQLKPVVIASDDEAAKEQSIVVRGQNAVTPTQYNQYVTPAAQPPAAAQPLVDAANSAVNSAANAAANAWNSSSAAPSSSQLFESASSAAQQAWNDNVAAPATDALNNAGQNLSNQLNSSIQQGINSASTQVQQQAQQGWNNAAQSVQNSATSLGDRTKSLINEAAQPLAQQPAATGRSVRNQPAAQPLQAVAPPATGSAASPYASAAPPATNAWNQNQQAPPGTDPALRSNLQPAPQSTVAANEWNGQPTTPFPNEPPLAQPTLGNNGGFAGSQQPQQPPALQQPAPQSNVASSGGMNDWNGASSNTPPTTPPLAASANASNGLANSGFGGYDPWAGVPDPRTPAATVGTTPTSTTPGSDLASQPVTPFRGSAVGDLGASPPNVAVPGIDRNMLSQSPGRPLDGTAGSTNGPGGVPATNASTTPLNAGPLTAGPTSNGTQQPSKTTPDIFANRQPPSTNPLANQPQTNQPNNVAATGAANPSNDHAVITLVAWVLLFGSAFGNLYLFWSYLDVRQKYRSLVRKTARAVGSRFSAA
jgi:hypothetical protein